MSDFDWGSYGFADGWNSGGWDTGWDSFTSPPADLPFDASNPPPDPSLFPAPSGGGNWWDDIVSGGRSVLSALGSGSGIAGIAGALLSSGANRDAANARAAAATEAARMSSDAYLRGVALQQEGNAAARAQYADAANRGVAAIQGGTQNYAATIAPLLNPTPVTLPTYRGLTAAEEIAAQDQHRAGMATLAASGLRGAGRAGIGAVMDQDRRLRAASATQNDNRRLSAMQTADTQAKNARSALAGIYANEGGAIANTLVGAGNRIGENLSTSAQQAAQGGVSAANATGQGLTTAAGYGADADLANAQLYGGALGTISSLINGSTKEANRDTYQTREVA